MIAGLASPAYESWIAFDRRKQGWHDKLAGTVVVRPKLRGPEPVRFSP